ncbi:MAG TPA: hypothetical protein VNV66_00495 [Pilimelia sp.]|nr:hypothetical protein [Pilimelia sp.]
MTVHPGSTPADESRSPGPAGSGASRPGIVPPRAPESGGGPGRPADAPRPAATGSGGAPATGSGAAPPAAGAGAGGERPPGGQAAGPAGDSRAAEAKAARRPWWAALALGAAGLAVLIALAALVLSFRANAVAERAAARVGAPPPAGAPSSVASPAPTSDPPSEPAGEESGPSSPAPLEDAPLNPQTVYERAYVTQTLRLQVPDSCSAMRADLDEPRAAVSEDRADLVLQGPCSGGDTLRLQVAEGGGGSTVTDTSAGALTAVECDDRIRKAPLATGAFVPVQPGVVLCVATSPAAAQQQGHERRMAVVEVKAVGRDGTVAIEVRAWKIPS